MQDELIQTKIIDVVVDIRFMAPFCIISQAQLTKLPKNLLAKVSTIKNTEQVYTSIWCRIVDECENKVCKVCNAGCFSFPLQVLEQLPGVISSLDAYMENGLQKFEPSLV